MKKSSRPVSQIKWGAVISYLTIAFNILAGLLYTPWMVRSIGNSQYALYAMATSVISIFVMDFGLSSAVSKFLSQFYARGDREKANRFLGTAFFLYSVLSGIIFLVLAGVYFFLDSIYANLSAGGLQTFKTLYLICAAYSVVSFPFTPLDSILTSNEKFIALRLCSFFQKVLTVVLIIAALLFNAGVFALVAANALCGLLTIIVKLILIRKYTDIKIHISKEFKEFFRILFSFSIWLTVSQIAQTLINNMAPSVLGVFFTTQLVTYFSLANTLEHHLFTVSSAINGMFLPRVARLIEGNDSSRKITDLMCKVGRLHVYLDGLIIIGFACVGRHFVRAWMGVGYDEIYYCALAQMVPILLFAPQQIGYTAMVAENQIKWEAVIYSVAIIPGVALLIILSKLAGAFGGGIAVGLVTLVAAVCMNIVFKKKLGLDIKRYFKEAYKSWLIPAAITTALGIVVNNLLSSIGWFWLGIKAFCITMLYCFLVYFMSFNGFEKSLVKGLVLKIIPRRTT